MRAGGIVLCGGRSTRMGTSKAWLPLGEEPMLLRVLRILRAFLEPVVVVAAPEQDLPPLPLDVELVRDPVEGLGPLAGFAAGLTTLETRCEAVFLSACDAPLLQTEFVRGILARLDGFSVVVPQVNGYFHPLSAAYRTSIRPEVEALLAAGERRMHTVFNRVPTRIVTAVELATLDPHGWNLQNVNTPEDYADCLRRISECVPSHRGK